MSIQVSSSTAVSSALHTQAQPQSQQPKPAAPSAPQDTVHVSKQALSASGDSDHDGDSH